MDESKEPLVHSLSFLQSSIYSRVDLVPFFFQVTTNFIALCAEHHRQEQYRVKKITGSLKDPAAPHSAAGNDDGDGDDGDGDDDDGDDDDGDDDDGDDDDGDDDDGDGARQNNAYSLMYPPANYHRH